jgi:hypothetical protein
VRHFIEDVAVDGAAEVTLPDMKCFTEFLHKAIRDLPPETLFAVIDLLRAAMADLRFSGYFAVSHHKVVILFFSFTD